VHIFSLRWSKKNKIKDQLITEERTGNRIRSTYCFHLPSKAWMYNIPFEFAYVPIACRKRGRNERNAVTQLRQNRKKGSEKVQPIMLGVPFAPMTGIRSIFATISGFQ
jgi:hypothetical protein